MKDTLCFRLFAQVELHPSWLVRRWPRCGRRARASPRGISMHFDRGFTPFQIFRYIPSTSFIALPIQQRYLGLGLHTRMNYEFVYLLMQPRYMTTLLVLI